MDVDVALLGGGGAGLTVLDALASARRHGPGPLRVAVIDPVRHRGNDRTWCFWDDGAGPVDEVVHRHWSTLSVVGPDAVSRPVDLTPRRYVMVRSADYYARVARRAERLDVTWLAEPAGAVRDGTRHAEVATPAGTVRARWVFDSRPRPPTRPGVTTLLQHFHGWWVTAGRDVFDPDTATLMDFAVPQPDGGLAFCYLLPLSRCRALVEYTVFSRERHDRPRYERALADHLAARYSLAVGDFRVDETEDGAIPMTDAPFPRRVGRRVMRIGTAGGATRPATGYTFTAMLRQAAGIADRLAAGAVPVPPRPYPRRHRLFDGVLLRALDTGGIDGPTFFTGLLTGQPIDRVLRFLDGTSGAVGEFAVLSRAPGGAMTRAAAGYLTRAALRTVRRRP
ncbi:MAG: lycopene cyclase family protein [Actinocatenispora sp.]